MHCCWHPLLMLSAHTRTHTHMCTHGRTRRASQQHGALGPHCCCCCCLAAVAAELPGIGRCLPTRGRARVLLPRRARAAGRALRHVVGSPRQWRPLLLLLAMRLMAPLALHARVLVLLPALRAERRALHDRHLAQVGAQRRAWGMARGAGATHAPDDQAKPLVFKASFLSSARAPTWVAGARGHDVVHDLRLHMW